MPSAKNRLAAVIAEIDAANAEDPRRIELDGESRPFESVYAERMSERLADMYPEASEQLRIAARGQHLRRWDIARADYPEGRNGYNDWRKTCREHHAELLAKMMARHGYGEDEIAQVGRFVKKQKLKKDPESQALENVVDVVFCEHYLEDFVIKYSQYDEDKLIDIVGKTLRKMSPKGHAAALAVPMKPEIRAVVDKAVAREADTLEKLAKHALD